MRDLDVDFPRMKNNSPFEEVIKFLGSAEMVCDCGDGVIEISFTN